MPKITLKLGEEYTPANEGEGIREVVYVGKDELQEVIRSSEKPIPREQHPKQFGCVWAEFTVEENLPAYLQEGVFKKPRTFPAWIRFSSRKEKFDHKGDVSHGMAIKLMDVKGRKVLEGEEGNVETQDFLMVDYPVFPIKNVEDYVISRNEKHEWLKPLRLSFRMRPFKIFGRELWIAMGLSRNRTKKLRKIRSPLEVQYWSMVPYRLGLEPIHQPWSTTPHGPCLRAIKFFVKPRLPQNRLNSRIPKSENYLREALSTFLSQKDAYFDFYVQLQTDPERMPIEDPRIEWRGALEHKVATIRIPAQVFDTSDQQEFGEHLSFTPWHCLPEHKPLGGINRARREAYQASSMMRHQANQLQRQEPNCQSSEQFKKLIDLPQSQQALTVLVPIKDGDSKKNLEQFLLGKAEEIKTTLRQSASTHFARWVIIEDAERGLQPHLLFTSNYDGRFEYYLKELMSIKAICSYIDEIWGYCKGYNAGTVYDSQQLIEFIKEHQFKEQVFGIAHPGKTVDIIHKDHRVRQLLDQLLDDRTVQVKLQDFQELLFQRSSMAKRCDCHLELERPLPIIDNWSVPIIERLVGIRHGHREPDKQLEWNENRKRQLKETEDKTAQNEMTILVAIKPGCYWWMLLSWLVLPLTQRRIDECRSTIMKLKTIHFARWVMLKKQRLENPKFNYLLFESNYNGDWDGYINDFINIAGQRLNCIWGNCIEYPVGGSEDENWFKQHIRKYQFPAQIFYSAYDDLTVRDIEVNDQISTVALDFLGQKGVQSFVAGGYNSLS